MSDALREAAQAVLDRWDSPQWQWTKHGPTADLMHALRAALAQPVPAGWQVVPVEATHAMIEAFTRAVLGADDWNGCPESQREEVRRLFAAPYRAMLAAAPQAPQPGAEDA